MINKIILNVEGMSCSHCENAVKKAVLALSGIDDISVDLAAKTVTVAYDDAKVSPANMKEAIEDQGYDVI